MAKASTKYERSDNVSVTLRDIDGGSIRSQSVTSNLLLDILVILERNEELGKEQSKQA